MAVVSRLVLASTAAHIGSEVSAGTGPPVQQASHASSGTKVSSLVTNLFSIMRRN